MTFASTSKQIAVAVIGFALAALGGFFLWRVMQPTIPPTTPDRHLVYFFVAVMVGGAFMVAPDILSGIGQKLMALWLEYKNGKVQPLFFGLVFSLLFLPSFVRPNPKLTPGDVLTTNRDSVCTLGWAGRHRHVTPAQHHAIFAAYGIPWEQHSASEDDHLVSLQLGGSNENRNRWPQPYPQAYSKDSVENALHRAVCKGQLPLDSAQRWIAHDWVSAYRAMKKGQL